LDGRWFRYWALLNYVMVCKYLPKTKFNFGCHLSLCYLFLNTENENNLKGIPIHVLLFMLLKIVQHHVQDVPISNFLLTKGLLKISSNNIIFTKIF
jgi:hypothetical protein